MLLALAFAILIPQSARDTTYVRSSGQGKWGPPKNAIEELRLGGSSSSLELGSIDCLAALPDGGVAIFDAKGPNGPVIRVLDAHGTPRLSLGRNGAGPGEFGTRSLVGCLAVTSDGTLLMLDRTNNRVNRWTGDGKLLASIPLPSGVGGPPPYILPGPARTVYVRVAVANPQAGVGMDWSAYGYVRVGENGRVLDTLAPLRDATSKVTARRFDPKEFLAPLEDGRLLRSNSATLAFTISAIPPNRSVLSVMHQVPPIKTLPGERREQEADLAFWTEQTKGMVPNPGVAPIKAAFADMRVDVQGRVWFQRNVTAIKGETITPQGLPGRPSPPGQSYLMPPVFAAFERDGTFLGEVRIPLRQAFLLNFTFAGEYVWGSVTDNDGFPLLVRWRIPGAGKR